ncbi:MAG: helix-turn-helix domain-containing protein [Alphaproteobacteria bacterium]|nr:helix-turn-helix domain-containing protein [Alphaproteobacteria bacterium]
MAEPARPYTPQQVAWIWGCSPNHVRAEIKAGRLRAFRLGRLIRIPRDAVQEYEQCQTIKSDDCATDTSSHGTMTAASDDAIVLTHIPERKRRAQP